MAAVYKSLSRSAGRPAAESEVSEKKTKRSNAQRVLILASRGINFRHRHFLNDIASLLPHGRKESKFDSKKNLNGLCELADLYNCNNVLFLEARKHQDMYLHLAKIPNGPTAKFHVQNLHTMEELHFTGNCLKGSRPILSFDAAFDRADNPHLRLLRELFLHVFGVPERARKAKPFIDRVMAFSFADGRIFVRQYQVVEEEGSKNNGEDMSLVEIGPRFCLTPMIIQEGSFSGPILYSNKHFVSPNSLRADYRRQRVAKHVSRQENRAMRHAKGDALGDVAQRDALDSRELFA